MLSDATLILLKILHILEDDWNDDCGNSTYCTTTATTTTITTTNTAPIATSAANTSSNAITVLSINAKSYSKE